jgi:hypothetical protein
MRGPSRSLVSRARTPLLAPIVAGVIIGGLPAVAYASMSATTPASSSTWSSLSVAAATGLGATAACGPLGSLAAQITLVWTPSVTSRLTSQVVLRRPAGTGLFTSVATLATTATSYVDSGLPVTTGYDYEIRSTVNGFATDTALVTVTTPAVCL